jgi:protein-tyrosine phosphatase
MGYVDLHSHVLPGLDDGCQAIGESVELMTLLGKMGFETVCATPHQKVGFFCPTREAIDSASDEVRRATAGLPVELRLGAENFWDELFLERSLTQAQPSYTGGHAFLFELPTRHVPPRLEEMLFQIRIKGLLPVMAHPERYAPLWEDEARAEALARTAAFVVDLGALDGAHGKMECKAAQRLVQSGIAHAVATDVHTTSDARSAAAGMAWIKKKMGAPALERLLADHPRRILEGELPD